MPFRLSTFRISAVLLFALLAGVVCHKSGWAAVAGQDRPGSARQRPLAVSLIQLIAHPDKYDGKQVRIFGYVRVEHEGTSVYLHREDYEQGLRTNGLWLHANDVAAPGSKEAAVNNRYALIEGKFVAKDHGHLGLWSGAIADITRMEPWPPRPSKEGKAKPQADLLKDYPRSEAFAANVNWHRQAGDNEVRLSWFLQGDPKVAMIGTVDLAHSESWYAREVHNWATQASHTQKLSHYQTVTVRKIIDNLPASANHPALADLVLVTVRQQGQPITHVYSRHQLPLEIVRLYDVSGAYLETGVKK